MTALTRVLRRLRGPWVADSPAPDLSWLDRKDGLTNADGLRRCPLCPPETYRARTDLHATLRAEGTRYDAQWPDVRAAEAGGWAGGDLPPKWADLFGIDPGFVGGDLAAMAAPLTDWGVDWRYVDAPADLLAGMARDDLGTYAEPVEPHGRHRQTDPLDLILADLRDLGGLS